MAMMSDSESAFRADPLIPLAADTSALFLFTTIRDDSVDTLCLIQPFREYRVSARAYKNSTVCTPERLDRLLIRATKGAHTAVGGVVEFHAASRGIPSVVHFSAWNIRT